MVKTDLDPDPGVWRVLETYTMPTPTFGDGLFPELTKFPLWRVRHFAGDPNTYLIHESPAAIMRVDAAGRRLIPVALRGTSTSRMPHRQP